jgi:hypothetical protein
LFTFADSSSLSGAGAGGAMLSPESIETPTSEKKMVGSVFVIEAENIVAVRKAIEEDIYYTSGVVSDFVLVLD